jgi:hypothetical protein
MYKKIFDGWGSGRQWTRELHFGWRTCYVCRFSVRTNSAFPGTLHVPSSTGILGTVTITRSTFASRNFTVIRHLPLFMIEPGLIARPSQSAGCRMLRPPWRTPFDAAWKTNTKYQFEVHCSRYLHGRLRFTVLQVFLILFLFQTTRSWIIEDFFVQQLIHKWAVLKTILKFTLKLTLKQLRHVSVQSHHHEGAHSLYLLKLQLLK